MIDPDRAAWAVEEAAGMLEAADAVLATARAEQPPDHAAIRAARERVDRAEDRLTAALDDAGWSRDVPTVPLADE